MQTTSKDTADLLHMMVQGEKVFDGTDDTTLNQCKESLIAEAFTDVQLFNEIGDAPREHSRASRIHTEKIGIALLRTKFLSAIGTVDVHSQPGCILGIASGIRHPNLRDNVACGKDNDLFILMKVEGCEVGHRAERGLFHKDLVDFHRLHFHHGLCHASAPNTQIDALDTADAFLRIDLIGQTVSHQINGVRFQMIGAIREDHHAIGPNGIGSRSDVPKNALNIFIYIRNIKAVWILDQSIGILTG